MSHHSPSAAPQPQLPSSNPHSNPELAKRIERFQEAAQDLLAMYEPPEQGREDIPLPEQRGETRCYYLSPGTVQHERELLKRYRAEDFRGLLAETHMLLVGLVKVMKNTHHDVRVKGYVIASLGCKKFFAALKSVLQVPAFGAAWRDIQKEAVELSRLTRFVSGGYAPRTAVSVRGMGV